MTNTHTPTNSTPHHHSVGAAVVGAAERYADTPPLRLLVRLLVPAPMCALAAEASKAAAAEDHTLQLPDLGVILLGYLMMSAMVRVGALGVCFMACALWRVYAPADIHMYTHRQPSTGPTPRPLSHHHPPTPPPNK